MKTVFTIGEAADALGVTVETIRYYEQIGVIEKSTREANGYRKLTLDQVLEIKGILLLRQCGFSLKAIENRNEALTLDQLTKQLEWMTQEIQRLEATKSKLQMGINQWKTFQEAQDRGVFQQSIQKKFTLIEPCAHPLKQQLQAETLTFKHLGGLTTVGQLVEPNPTLNSETTFIGEAMCRMVFFSDETQLETIAEDLYQQCLQKGIAIDETLYLEILEFPSVMCKGTMAGRLFFPIKT